jgi:hypothetical protein
MGYEHHTRPPGPSDRFIWHPKALLMTRGFHAVASLPLFRLATRNAASRNNARWSGRRADNAHSAMTSIAQ